MREQIHREAARLAGMWMRKLLFKCFCSLTKLEIRLSAVWCVCVCVCVCVEGGRTGHQSCLPINRMND